MKRHLGSGLLVSLLIAVAIVTGATPAAACCIYEPSVARQIASADLVFVGRVESVTNRGRWATFVIDDLWKGTPGARRVEIRGGPEKDYISSSIDRTYAAGARYLVMANAFASHGDDGPYGSASAYVDSSCSGTQVYSEELDRFRPDNAPPPPVDSPVPGSTTEPSAPSADGGLSMAGTFTLGGALVGATTLVTWPLWRRRRRPTRL